MKERQQGGVSATVIHCLMECSHWGSIERPDCYALIRGPCGDTDEFSIRLEKERLREVRFRTDGCIYTIAACESVARLAEGESVGKVLRMTPAMVLQYLGGMPEEHEHCPVLALRTIQKALREGAPEKRTESLCD